MPTLEVYKGKTLIGSFLLKDDIITIGRSGDNHIVLPDKDLKVSRYHAALLKSPHTEEGYYIRDLSSKRGTQIKKRGKGAVQYIFQELISRDDVICISDFYLKHKTDTEDKCTPFRITEEIPDAPYASIAADISNQSTMINRLKEIIHNPATQLLHDRETVLQEILSQINRPFRAEVLFNRVIDILFNAFNLNDKSMGCVAIIEKQGIQCLAQRGMHARRDIPLPRPIIEKIKSGESFVTGSQLWASLGPEGEDGYAFLFFSRGPYEQPFQDDELQLAATISRLVWQADSRTKQENLEQDEIVKWPTEMVGNDQTAKIIKRIAPLNVNVLILGETGVGKNVAAYQLHRDSRRKEKIFRKVTCPTKPATLLESELFGHKKGAFTGATEDKRGEFELADGGTIFLDELADLPWESQRKLLGVIEDKVVQRLGEEKGHQVDVRIIAGTNKDITKEMEEGRFGSDLYFRFEERLVIPPLRERRRDIPLLAHYFLDNFAVERKLSSRGITPQAMRCLLDYHWPGNIRELRDCIGSALSQSDGVILVQHLPLEIQRIKKSDNQKKSKRGQPQSLDEIEKEHIVEALQYCKGNKDKTIKCLKISRQTLYNKMEKYKIPINFGTE